MMQTLVTMQDLAGLVMFCLFAPDQTLDGPVDGRAISHDGAVERAVSEIRRRALTGTLHPSWTFRGRLHSVERPDKPGSLWVVTFANVDPPKTSERTLCITLDEDGTFVAVNFVPP